MRVSSGRRRSEVGEHPKTLRLAEILGHGDELFKTVGHLAMLWSWAEQHSPTGALVLDDSSVAEVCGWHGDAAVLMKALREAGWVDQRPFQRLHDWSHHAVPSVHRELAYRGELFCDGAVPCVGLLHSRARAEAARRLAEAKKAYDASRVPRQMGQVLRFEARA